MDLNGHIVERENGPREDFKDLSIKKQTGLKTLFFYKNYKT